MRVQSSLFVYLMMVRYWISRRKLYPQNNSSEVLLKYCIVTRLKCCIAQCETYMQCSVKVRVFPRYYTVRELFI